MPPTKSTFSPEKNIWWHLTSMRKNEPTLDRFFFFGGGGARLCTVRQGMLAHGLYAGNQLKDDVEPDTVH